MAMSNSNSQSVQRSRTKTINTVDASTQTDNEKIRGESACVSCKEVLACMKTLFIEMIGQLNQNRNETQPET